MGIPLVSAGEAAIVWEPGALLISHVNIGSEIPLGQVDFEYRKADKLATDQQLALQSNPVTNVLVSIQLACKECGAAICPICASSKHAKTGDAINPVWYEDLPDTFSCHCKKVVVPLRYLRESMHCLLLLPHMFRADGTMKFTSQISEKEANATLGEFLRLLDTEPAEEAVQTFIKNHPLILAPFGARNLFLKPPILTQYRADFGIVTSRRELLLIEIERPGLPLIKKDGTQTAELTKAFSQPHSWRQVVDQHRLAVLAAIAGCPTDISAVRYLVIAGRTGGYNQQALDRLVLQSRDPEFMTYDHLIEHVAGTVKMAVQ